MPISKDLVTGCVTRKHHLKHIGEFLNLSFLGKKVPIIPSIFDGIKFITDFKVKSDLFNSYFANQCSIINNGSTLPDTNFDFNCTLSSLTFDENELLKLIQSLDVNKSHGHDGISAWMIKLCDTQFHHH